MGEVYFSGCIVAFLLGCITLIVYIYNAIFGRTRVQTENYHKVLMFYKFSECKFSKDEPHPLKNIIGAFFYQLIVNVLFSWISVLLRIIGLIAMIKLKRKTKNTYSKDTLKRIKELELKIKYTELSEQEMKSYLKEIDDLLGIQTPSDDNCGDNEEEISVCITLEDNSPFRTKMYIYDDKIRVDDEILEFGGRDDTEWLEYKVEGTDVFIRTYEYTTNEFVKMGDFSTYDAIEDGVVIESEIKEHFKNKDNKFITESDLKSFIQRCKEKIEWRKLRYLSVDKNYDYIDARCVILSKKLSKDEFRKYVRTEIERLKSGMMDIKDLCEKYKVKYEYKEEWGTYEFNYSECSKAKKDKAYEEINKILPYNETSQFDRIIKYLESCL